jgi:DNA-binding Lrp family transcriptional regulator
VQNRIQRLMQAGILAGFTIRLRGDAGLGQVRAITSLEVRSADGRAVIAALRRLPDVGRVYSTNGRWDLVVEINTATLASLDQVLAEIRALPAVTHSETSILLSELK